MLVETLVTVFAVLYLMVVALGHVLLFLALFSRAGRRDGANAPSPARPRLAQYGARDANGTGNSNERLAA